MCLKKCIKKRGPVISYFFNKFNNIILTIDFDKYVVVISRCPCEIIESRWFPIIFLLQSAGLYASYFFGEVNLYIIE